MEGMSGQGKRVSYGMKDVDIMVGRKGTDRELREREAEARFTEVWKTPFHS